MLVKYGHFFFSFYLFSVSLLLLRYDLWPRIQSFLKKKCWWYKVLSSLLYVILKLHMVKKIRMKHLKRSLMDQWIKKMWYIHTMKCCSAFYKKESKFWHTTTWVNLDSMLLLLLLLLSRFSRVRLSETP